MRRAARILLVAGVALIAACTVASSGVLRPPEHFRGDNWAVVTWVDIAQVDGACRQMGATDSGRIQGCAHGRSVVLPNPCRLEGFSAEVSCHELAHVNGWSHDPVVTASSE